MKKKHSLPIEMTPYLCDERLVFSHAILRSVSKEYLKVLLCMEYINCYFREDELREEFNIAMHDPWFTRQGIMEHQAVNLLKETYQKGNMNLISIIKKSLLYDSYVLGQCNRSCVEAGNGVDPSWMYYAITGFNEVHHEFTVCGLDSSHRFRCWSVDMERFIEALYDTPFSHITLDLWKYHYDASITFVIDDIIFSLEDYLNSENRLKQNKWHKIYGLAAIDALCESLQKHFEDEKAINLSYLELFALHKSYMRERIEHLISIELLNGNFLARAEAVEKLAQEVREWGELVNRTHGKDALRELVDRISQTVSIEREYLTAALYDLKH